jgi:alanyl-tRNA synthetase
MQPFTSSQLRKSFLEYFQQNHHTYLQSSSLIPSDDRSLLFTNSGMVQLKTYYLNYLLPPSLSYTSIQSCLRAGGKHNDLENVGLTARHHTWFEMCGNFSFGAYGKKEAIEFAWNYLTKILCLPAERLMITVYQTDDEAAQIWKQVTGWKDGEITGKIQRKDEKDNFWSMGETGKKINQKVFCQILFIQIVIFIIFDKLYMFSIFIIFVIFCTYFYFIFYIIYFIYFIFYTYFYFIFYTYFLFVGPCGPCSEIYWDQQKEVNGER